MIFYKFYPGDYTRDTIELTAEEEGIYIRLLNWYYSNEKPIPSLRATKIARAMSSEEQEKTYWVLSRFFKKVDMDDVESWVNDRAEKEIVLAQKRIVASQNNGKRGGRPLKEKPAGLSTGNLDGTKQQSYPDPDPDPDPDPESDTKIKTTRKRVNTYSAEFELFRSKYPKHRLGGKGQDWKSWKAAKVAGMTADVAHEYLEYWTASPKWGNGYIVAISKWLRDGYWETMPADYEPSGTSDNRTQQGRHQQNMDFLADEWRKAKEDELKNSGN